MEPIFTSGVLPYKKFAYQEGHENDVKLVCANGVVTGGSIIISSKSRFLEHAIKEARKKQTG